MLLLLSFACLLYLYFNLNKKLSGLIFILYYLQLHFRWPHSKQFLALNGLRQDNVNKNSSTDEISVLSSNLFSKRDLVVK